MEGAGCRQSAVGNLTNAINNNGGYQSPGGVVVRRSRGAHVPHAGLRTSRIPRVLAVVRAGVLRAGAGAAVRGAAPGRRRRRRGEQRVPRAGALPHHGHRRVGVRPAHRAGPRRHDQVGCVRSGADGQHGHLPHHPGLLPRVRAHRRVGLPGLVTGAAATVATETL